MLIPSLFKKLFKDMAKHLLKFDTAAEYSAATIVPPAVSWVVINNEIKNDFYVPPSYSGKVRLIYSNGEVYEVPADGNTMLTRAEVRGGSMDKLYIVSAEIGSAVTIIGRTAFQDCSSLTGITIPDSVTSIDEYAFYGCSSLTGSIVIPSGVTSIGNSTFNGCSSLTSIDIPSGVTSIGKSAFSGCKSLTSINIPSGVTSISYATFYECTNLTSINIPSGVTSIGDSAFQYCSGLTRIDIPSGVTTIDNVSFRNCSSLTSITCNPINPPTLGNEVFTDTTATIYVPSESVNAYKSASGWSTYDDRIHGINGDPSDDGPAAEDDPDPYDPIFGG